MKYLPEIFLNTFVTFLLSTGNLIFFSCNRRKTGAGFTKFNYIIMGHFIVKKDADGHYSVTLKAKGGHVILNGIKHLSKSSCKVGIEIIRANATDTLKYEYKKTFDGKFYFRLKSVHGEVLGNSKIYETAEHRNVGIETTRKIAPLASVIDLDS